MEENNSLLNKNIYPFVTHGECSACKSPWAPFDLVKRKSCSGHYQVFYQCRTCVNKYPFDGKLKVYDPSDPQNINRKTFLPKSYLDFYEISIDDLIEIFPKNLPRCFVCNSPGAELHHFAPRHLFDDHDSWPLAYLCDFHHKEWHEKIKNHFK